MKIGIINNEVNQTETTTKLSSSVVLDDHSYCWQKDTRKYLACVDQMNFIEVLVNETNELKLENKFSIIKTLQIVIGHVLHDVKLKHAKMGFYTGIQTIEMFNVISILIKPYLPNIAYWAGPAKDNLININITST